MICQSKSKLKVRGADGIVREIPPGEIFQPKDPAQVQLLIEKGAIRVVQDTETVMRSFRDEVIRGGRWKASPETREAETEMEVAQRSSNVIDFYDACQRWKRAGTT